MTTSIAGRSEYALGICGLLFSVALAPMWMAGCAEDPVSSTPATVMDADAGASIDLCTDGRQSGRESDVDCGGPCGKCGDGRSCASDADCANNACIAGYCRAPSCNDGRKNGDETDVDCGAGCGPCAVGMACAKIEDCSTGLCGQNAKCLPTTCGDKMKNDVESDVDCGGACAPCAAAMACRTGYDCASGVCNAGKCATPACDDTVLNGDETDLDCGGSCSTKCTDGKKCNLNEHCDTNICSAQPWGDTTRRCRAPGCSNYAKDSGETDVDCGGPCSSKCQDGQGCLVGDDCWSKVCDGTTGKCLSATCSDGVQNGSESDVDCGSSCPCEAGRRCTWDGECASGVCDEDAQTCLAPTCSDGVMNADETDVDCGGGCAAKCNEGQHCASTGDCAVGSCIAGHCTP